LSAGDLPTQRAWRQRPGQKPDPKDARRTFTSVPTPIKKPA